MYSKGLGLHVSQVSEDQLVGLSKVLLAGEVAYAWNLCWSKLSVLLLYYRIFYVDFSYFKKAAYVVGGFVLVWGLVATFMFLFHCIPISKAWDPSISGHCTPTIALWVANATSTLVTDIVILVLPIPQVWALRLRRVEKLAVTFIFALGFL